MKKLTIIPLAAILLLACSKEVKEQQDSLQATLASQPANKSQTTRAFMASLYSSVDTNPSIPPTACSGDIPGLANPGYFLHGNATHLGELSWQQSRGQDIACNLSFASMLLTTTVSGQLAAANGDLVYYTGADEIDASTFLSGAGTAGTIQGVWTITGGTGRFVGATGSFTIYGPADFATGTFRFEAVGTITY